MYPSVSLGLYNPSMGSSWGFGGESKLPPFSSASNQTRRRCHVPEGPAEGAGSFAEQQECRQRRGAEVAPASRTSM